MSQVTKSASAFVRAFLAILVLELEPMVVRLFRSHKLAGERPRLPARQHVAAPTSMFRSLSTWKKAPSSMDHASSAQFVVRTTLPTDPMDSRSRSEPAEVDLLGGPGGLRCCNKPRKAGGACSERGGAFAPDPPKGGRSMTQQQLNRRNFLNSLGITVGAAAATSVPAIGPAVAQVAKPPKGNIPSTPLKFGHMTFLTGPGAVLGDPSLKGHILAAEEINAQGGILGKRKIETITADENAGTDANVKELRRMKLSEKIDMFTGVISSGNTPALGPVAEELGVLTIFVDGCTDSLWDKAVPNPKFAFRITNIQSADGVTCAVAAAQTWPTAKKIAHIHPDYSYGRNAFDHFMIAYKKMVPGAEVVSEGWPKLGTTDFTAHITKAISSNPDLIMSSVWGGDYVALYKQALRYGMFNNAKFASTIAFGVAPHAIGKDHPEGVIAGVHSNYYFTFPREIAGRPTRPSWRSISSAGT